MFCKTAIKADDTQMVQLGCHDNENLIIYSDISLNELNLSIVTKERVMINERLLHTRWCYESGSRWKPTNNH